MIESPGHGAGFLDKDLIRRRLDALSPQVEMAPRILLREDPATMDGTDEEVMAAFRRTRDELKRLYEVLAARTGIGGDERLADALREGRDEYVLSVVRSTA